MSATIRGMGLWLPPTVRGNDAWPASFSREFAERHRRDLTRIVPEKDALGAIAARHAERFEADPFRGARTRHIALGTPPSEGEALAARAAMADAGVGERDIDLVLSHSLVPDRLTPPNAAVVAHRLGLRRAAAYGVDAVCASVVAQLTLACAMVEAGRARNVLLVQSHVLSPTLDLEQPASAIFGDGAAALVVGQGRPDHGLLAQVALADGSLHGAVTFEHGGGPSTPWYDPTGRFSPSSADREATRTLTSRLLHLGVDTMHMLLDEARVGAAEIDALATIQPTAWYSAALAEALRVPAERAPSTFGRIAHVGAAGVVANLLEARSLGLLREGALVALYAHGAGVNRTAALLRWA